MLFPAREKSQNSQQERLFNVTTWNVQNFYTHRYTHRYTHTKQKLFVMCSW